MLALESCAFSMLTLYTARYVYPVTSAPIADGAVATEDGRIVAVGAAAELGERFPQARRVDLGDSALLPAFANAHTHLELTGHAGTIPEGLPFADWVMALVAESRKRTPENFIRAAEVGIALLRAAGVAAVGEICTYGASVRPIVESGLRGIVYFELLSPYPEHAAETLARGQVTLAEWRATYPAASVRFGLSLHTPYTVSAELFEMTTEWCLAEAIPLCIHAAESPAETQWLRNASGPIAETLYARAGWPIDPSRAPGCSPIAYLDRLGVLRTQPLLAHGVEVNSDDLGTLARSGSTVAHCPRSNTRLLCERLPYAAYRAAGVPLALGTDSLASSPSLALWEEAVAANELHTAAGEAPAPAELLRMATLDGAAALGVNATLGSLEAGKLAELTAARLDQLDQCDCQDADAVLAALVTGRIVPRRLAE